MKKAKFATPPIKAIACAGLAVENEKAVFANIGHLLLITTGLIQPAIGSRRSQTPLRNKQARLSL
jgi:hypothetical protein